MEDMFKARPARGGGGEKLARDALQHAVRDGDSAGRSSSSSERFAGAGAAAAATTPEEGAGARTRARAGAEAEARAGARARAQSAGARRRSVPAGAQRRDGGGGGAPRRRRLAARAADGIGLFRGRTLLHLAASADPALVAELLRRGADRMAPTRRGRRRRRSRRKQGHDAIAQILDGVVVFPPAPAPAPPRRPRRRPLRARSAAGAGAAVVDAADDEDELGKLFDAAIARGALSEGDADRFTDAIASGAMSEADCIDEWRQRLGVTSAAEL